jgi:hypothetical protein
MGMTALELVQEAAKRLNIMLPSTIVVPDTPDTNAIDYDANLLVSSLNSVIKQNMTLNLFNRQILPKSVNLMEGDNIHFLNNQVDKNPVYSDFVVNLSGINPDFEELMGDGFNVSVFELNEPTIYKKKSYLFRQLTATDYLRLKRTCVPTQIPTPGLNRLWESFSKIPPLSEEMKEYRKNMPSEDRTSQINATNKESGFIILGDGNTNKIIYFCNNMIPDTEFNQEAGPFSQPPILDYLYRTNFGVINKMDGRVISVSVDDDEVVIPDELAILGTIINYKTYYGLDISLEMGQQKALIDALKENQQNVQVTHLDKKRYVTFHDNNTATLN